MKNFLNIKSSETFNVADGNDVQYCVLAPNGESLAYVLDNNIYHVTIEGPVVKQITSDGVLGEIVSNVFKRVYNIK